MTRKLGDREKKNPDKRISHNWVKGPDARSVRVPGGEEDS